MTEERGPGFTYEPYLIIQTRVEVTELRCPKCGCKDLEVINLL